MADNTRSVRVVEQLRIKVGEAKNLCARNSGAGGTAGLRDVYCTIALDQEEICRTPTMERTLNPFFGEEYKFEIPRKFRFLSLYLWDRDKHLKQDKPIGKIAIRKEDLHMYNRKDHWFPLRSVDSDSEVQGMAHIAVNIGNSFDERLSMNSNTNEFKAKQTKNNIEQLSIFRNEADNRVAIKVIECQDLTKKNGCCDPCVIFTALYTNKREITKRTKTRKKTVNPQFDEIMYFDLTINNDMKSESNNSHTIHPFGGPDLYEICVSFWHDTSNRSDKDFLGEVRIPIRGRQQQLALLESAWYYLKPRSSQLRPTRSWATPPGTRLSYDNSLGSLRINLVYTGDQVFPLATYDSLMNLLLESVDQKPITSSAVYILGEIIPSKTDVAQPLVRLFTYKNLIADIIKALADHEISKLTDPTTIFRGNTLVSKMMDEAMRLSGLHYLHNTLRPTLQAIVQEKKPCEIDPTKVKDKSVIDTNLLNLQDYVARVFDAIMKSAVRCPSVLCQIFHDLKNCAAKRFPMNREVRYSVVSGFIFLRFFAPAILGPKLFDLTSEPLDVQTNRTLTLISKTIQSLGNLVSSRSAQQPCKEVYTTQLYTKFCTEKHVEAVKHFLEVISTVGNNSSTDTLLEPVLLKEGMMTKRAQGRKRFGMRNFQKRYFMLTTHSLSYSKSKGKQASCDIPLSEISAVERLSDRSFKMQNIFQIINKGRPLYVQTTNCVEEKEWVDLLSKICQTNKARLESYHPCAFVNGSWSCCGQIDENASGCTQVSLKPFQMELSTALDPARDLQRLHTLIVTNPRRLDDLNDPNGYQSAIFEDVESLQRTICQLNEVAESLTKVHQNYKLTMGLQIKYGSKQVPIGDDNYLRMTRTNLPPSPAANL